MKSPPTLRDIRGAASLATCPGPASEQKTYAQLTVLARERQRLLGQQESWHRRLRQIAGRLAEIDARSEQLRGQLPELTQGHQLPGRRPRVEVEFRY